MGHRCVWLAVGLLLVACSDAKHQGTSDALMVAHDLAGADLTGADLASPPPPDLTGADLAGADLATVADLAPGADLVPPPLVMPEDPGAADTTTAIDTSHDRKAISRLIYGYNWYRSGASYPKNLTFDRQGGDRMCSYNWEKNVESSGGQNDDPAYFYVNDFNYYGVGANDANIAGDVVEGIDTNRARKTSTMPVLPLMDYVAGDQSGKVDIFGSTFLSHFLVNDLDSGIQPADAVTAPNKSDGVVKQDQFVHWLVDHYAAVPDLFTDPERRVIFGLDNEPELWLEAFAVLQRSSVGSAIPLSGAESGWMPPGGDTTLGHKVTPSEFIARTVKITKMLRRLAPEAEIMGPSHFGYYAMVNFNDGEWTQYDEAGTWFMDDYLGALKDESMASGVRLLDTFDFHWYPEPKVGAKRIIDIVTTASDAEFDAIVQNPRSFWDPTFDEDSDITINHTNGPIKVIPRFQARIEAAYPGTKLGITEYWPGGGGDIAGGIAEADLLGIFGKYGVWAAALWPYISWDDTQMRFVHGGMKMFRQYDGSSGLFGDTSVKTDFSSVVGGSAYASVDASSDDRVVVVVINKQKTAKTTAIKIAHTKKLTTAEVYTLTSAGADPVKKTDLTLTKQNAIVYSMPARSVTTLVFRP